MAGLQLQEFLNLSPYYVANSKTPGFDWERFQDKIDEISEVLFALLVAEETSEFIKSLTQKYVQLSVQGQDVARLVRDIAIGDVFIGDMPTEISKRLGIDPATAREIANQIVAQLFTPALEDIKKVQAAKFPGKLPAKQQEQGIGSRVQSTDAQTHQQHQNHYQGEELPESGGNIIDLRNQK